MDLTKPARILGATNKDNMTPRDFAYWLQGFFEISGVKHGLAPNHTALVRRHIQLVYTTHPGDLFVRGIEAVLENAPEAIPFLLGSYFEHVIAPQHPNPGKANAAHFQNLTPASSSLLIRC